jgi:carboxypeptidase family protein
VLCLAISPPGATLSALSAQQSAAATGEIVGTVSDYSGAVMPGVTVTVTARGTQAARVPSVVTNPAGKFRIANLPDDSYVLEAALSGFRPLTTGTMTIRDGARVDVGVIRMELELSAVDAELAAMGIGPGDLLVSMTTSAGAFNLVVATKTAPEAGAAFLKRVDGHFYDGGTIVPLPAIDGQQTQGPGALELVMNPDRHPEPFRAVITDHDLSLELGRQVFGHVWRWQERDDVVTRIRAQPVSGRIFTVPVTITHAGRLFLQ